MQETDLKSLVYRIEGYATDKPKFEIVSYVKTDGLIELKIKVLEGAKNESDESF